MDSLVAPTRFVDQAYAAILDAICTGTLKAGERLTQEGIAQRLNVSRQPVHNALLLLRAQGFVMEAGRRGVSVVPLDPALFKSIYQFRSAIEPLAVKLATPRLNAETIAEGRSLLACGRSAAMKMDRKALVDADMAFHSFIYELSDNSLILETMRVNWHHLRRAMGEVLRMRGLAKRVWKEHEAILESMAEARTGAAARLMYDHVTVAQQDVARTLGTCVPTR